MLDFRGTKNLKFAREPRLRFDVVAVGEFYLEARRDYSMTGIHSYSTLCFRSLDLTLCLIDMKSERWSIILR